jgi:hypothetical protein
MNKKYRNIIYQIIFWLVLAGVTGCGIDLFEEIKAPVIVNVEATSYEVNPGDTIRASVNVKNSDKDILKYEWTSNGGYFIPPYDQTFIYWKAPSEGGNYQIEVKVSNEEKSSTRSVTITVRSEQAPYVEILSPERGEYFAQYSTLDIQAIARHDNGIQQVKLYINDLFRDNKNGQSSDKYNFSYRLTESDSAGVTEIKIEAVANTTGKVGIDSVEINIEGIVLGK